MFEWFRKIWRSNTLLHLQHSNHKNISPVIALIALEISIRIHREEDFIGYCCKIRDTVSGQSFQDGAYHKLMLVTVARSLDSNDPINHICLSKEFPGKFLCHDSRQIISECMVRIAKQQWESEHRHKRGI